jgi:hypothetical protein
MMSSTPPLYRLTGGSVKDIPHPDADWSGFIRKVKYYSQLQGMVFCPVEKRMKYWIDVLELRKIYQAKAFSYSCSIS